MKIAGKVDAIILNYRTPGLAVEAARSARDEGAGSVTVVDNHSADGSLASLRRELEGIADVAALDENRGFAAGNNFGASLGSRPFILFINADAKLHPGALERMVGALEQTKTAGAAAPALFFPDGRAQASAYRFITPARLAKILFGLDRIGERLGWQAFSGNIDVRRNGHFSGPVESLYGPCFLVRRQAFEEAGGFDETFFLYCEETDFFLRLAKKGWTMHRVAAASATHHHGGSASQDSIGTLVTMQESLMIYSRKHFGPFGRFVVAWASIVGLAMRWLASLNKPASRRYLAALGVWGGWTPSADPRRRNRPQVQVA